MKIPFSYIITFISLIYGLAITHGLTCIAEYIQYRKKIKHYWVWWIWALFILLISLGFWVSIYFTWHDVEIIQMRTFFLIVIQSCMLYLTVYIYFNTLNELETNNLEDEFYKYKRFFFLMIAVQFLIIFYLYPLLKTDKPTVSFLLSSLANRRPILEISFILLAFINNKYFQSISAIIIVVIFGLSQFLFN